MTRPRQPSLRLLSLNVNGLQDKDKRRWLFNLLERDGIEPSYEQKYFAPEEKHGKLRLVASPDAREGSVKIHQDVAVYSSILAKDEEIKHELAENRYAWLQIVKGSVALKGEILNVSDGAAISNETVLKIKSLEDETEFLLFDLN